MIEQKKPIIEQIEEMVKDIDGSTPIDQLYSLYLLAQSNSDIEGDFVEIGSWCGRSASVLALAAEDAGVNKVVCIDLFPNRWDWYQIADESYSFKIKLNTTCGGYIYSQTEQTIWKEPFERIFLPVYAKNENMFDMFMNNIKKCGFFNIIFPIKGTASDIEEHLGKSFKCKFAFIDGEHGYTSVCNDIRNIEKYLVPGAWICFDDAFTSFHGVSRAIEDKIINNPSYTNAQQLTRKLFVARYNP